ncbi:MAG TPA: CAP domain-containing protein, partial [Planctomycetota bacterium]
MIAIVALALGQTLYTDHGNPTPSEQRVLWMLNRARSDPFAEGTRLAIPGGITESLTAGEAARTFAQPPLAMNEKLRAGARAYAQLMWDSNQFSHTVGGTTAPGRMAAAGYANLFNWAENLATGSAHTAENLEDNLMRDFSIPSRGHRTNMLDIYELDPGPPPQVDPGPRREVGIGFLDAGSSKSNIFQFILVQDFAEATGDAPFLVGSVYLDANNNNEYDLGEGLGGVDLTVTGASFHALSGSAGGYAFPCPASGTRDVTATSTSLPATVVVSRAFSSSNLLVDVRVAPQADGDADGLPDFWETRFGGGLAAGGDNDGDTFTNLAEFRGGSNPLVAGST